MPVSEVLVQVLGLCLVEGPADTSVSSGDGLLVVLDTAFSHEPVTDFGVFLTDVFHGLDDLIVAVQVDRDLLGDGSASVSDADPIGLAMVFDTGGGVERASELCHVSKQDPKRLGRMTLH